MQTEKLGVEERRILLTHWIGEAYNCFSKYDSSRYRCFEKTGCLITAVGSEDSMIQSECPTGHIVPGPLPSAVSVPGPVPCEISEPATISADDEMECNEDSESNEDVVLKMTIFWRYVKKLTETLTTSLWDKRSMCVMTMDG